MWPILIGVVYLAFSLKLFCVACQKTTRHSGHVSGNYEIYECDECGNPQSFKVK